MRSCSNALPAAVTTSRSTRQRAAIRTAIDTAGRPLSPQEVLDAAQVEVPEMGIATVYRNVKLLLDAGEIVTVTLPGESPRYESTQHEHHHHFQCNACKRVFDVHSCPGDLSALAPKGFLVEGHELTLYGLCDQCRPAKAARRPRAAAAR